MGAHNLMKNLGQSIGIAISGLLLSDTLKGYALEVSLHSVFIMLFVLALCAFVTSGLFLRKKETDVSLN
jgi:hypothetical protein